MASFSFVLTIRTLKYFNGWLAQNGYNVCELWAKIHVSIILLVYNNNYSNDALLKVTIIMQFLLLLCSPWPVLSPAGCHHQDPAGGSASLGALLHSLPTWSQDRGEMPVL